MSDKGKYKVKSLIAITVFVFLFTGCNRYEVIEMEKNSNLRALSVEKDCELDELYNSYTQQKCSTSKEMTNNNIKKTETLPETYVAVISSEVNNEILSGDVERVYNFFLRRLGKNHVMLSAYFDKEERNDFYRKMLKEDKKTMEASPSRLTEVLTELGKRSQVGDAILIYLDGHGNLEDLAKPQTNTIGFSDDIEEDDMDYIGLQKVLTEQLPDRQIMIFNLLCYGGGNHQVAFQMPNVSVAVGTSYRFSKTNPSRGDQFVKGFWQTLEKTPKVTFAMAYWQARLNDIYNADHAGLSSEVYVDFVLGQGDYAAQHKDPKRAGESLQVSIERTQSLGKAIARIEELHKKGEFAKPAEVLPKELMTENDTLAIEQLKWLQNICGTEKWVAAKAKYKEAKAKYKKKANKWAKKKNSKRQANKLLYFEEDMRNELCEEYFCLVLAREVMEKLDRLKILFSSSDRKEQQNTYLDLVKRENKPVLYQDK